MALHLALALAGATLIASPNIDNGNPDSGTTTPPAESGGTKAETFAAAAGQVLGAASACDIDKSRLDAAAGKVGDVVEGTIQDQDELTSAHDLFVEAVAAGRKSVASGETNCEAAESQLTDLEQAVQR